MTSESSAEFSRRSLITNTEAGANAVAAVFDSYVVKAQAIRADLKVKPAADVARPRKE